jgi:hypothetical protein
MSTSLPSKEAVFIDVPKVKNFSAKFQYNFFVPDEGVDGGLSGIPTNVLKLSSDQFDTKTIDQLATRVPRFVRFDFTPIAVPSYNKETTEQFIKQNNTKTPNQEVGYISNNLVKVIDEDFFSQEAFTAVNLNDQSINNKLFQLVSGTAMILLEDRAKADTQSGHKLAKETNAMTSDKVTFQFLSKFLVQPDEDNTFFFEKNASKLTNDVVERLKGVDIHVQVNNKFFNDIVVDAVRNPHSTFGTDYSSLFAVSKTAQQNARARSNSDMIHDDYRTVGKYVSLENMQSNTSTTQAEAKVIGFIIDKVEVLPNGQAVKHEPIVLENPYVSTAVDYNVKYYSTYAYTMRTVAEFTVPSIVEGTNELVTAKMLITSHPTRQWHVHCVDLRVPPSPTDFGFHFDHQQRRLVLSWTYPPTPERDVKKFQVFRRKTINEPFQLMQVYDFDDSQVKAEVNERYSPGLVIQNTSPTLMWMDPDFTRDGKYIYALATIDAHGLSSNLSEQFEVGFDRFKNRVTKRRISSSGAPKPYPNMYLDTDTFVDLMHDSGHKTMKVAFDPDHLSLYNDQQQDLRLLTTTKQGGKYRVSIINTDIQKEQVLDITLDDRRVFKDIDQNASKKQKVQRPQRLRTPR